MRATASPSIIRARRGHARKAEGSRRSCPRKGWVSGETGGFDGAVRVKRRRVVRRFRIHANSYGHEGGSGPSPRAISRLKADTVDSFLRWPCPSRQVTVPDFVGLRVPEIWEVALTAGVKVAIKAVTRELCGSGLIVRQDPLPNTPAKRDSTVSLHVSFDGSRHLVQRTEPRFVPSSE